MNQEQIKLEEKPLTSALDGDLAAPPLSQVSSSEIILSILCIVILTFLVFWRKIQVGQFLGDDFIFLDKVSALPFSLKGLASVGIFHIYHNTLLLATGFRPLPLALWGLLYRMFGMQPAAYHAVILILHAGNAVLMYYLMRKFFPQAVALVSACIFAVFTGHTEAVQWLSGFFDVLCLLFFLSSLLLFTEFLKKRSQWFYAASFAFAIFAILSKETAVTLPLVLAALCVFLYRQKDARGHALASATKLTAPYFLLFAVYLIFRRIFLWNYRTAGDGFLSFFGPAKLLNVFRLLENMLVPHLKIFQPLLPILVLIFLAVLLVSYKMRKAARFALLFGGAWVIITALPTLGFIDSVLYFQRFNYLPAVGFSLIVAQVVVFHPQNSRRRLLYSLAPALVIGIFSLNTIQQVKQYWEPAWAASEQVQLSLREDVAPNLQGPTKAYFRNVPELVNRIDVFFTGFQQAFQLLIHRDKVESYFVSGITTAVVPFIENAEKPIPEKEESSFIFYEWDTAKKRFEITNTVTQAEFQEHPGETNALSWDFLRYNDFSQWEPSQDIGVVHSTDTGSFGYMTTFGYVTTGKDSFLKSPFLGGRRIRYVRVKCVASHHSRDRLTGQIFWVTRDDLKYNGKKSVRFGIENDGLLHTYTVPLYVNSLSFREPIQRLALRLSDRPDTFLKLDSITIRLY